MDDPIMVSASEIVPLRHGMRVSVDGTPPMIHPVRHVAHDDFHDVVWVYVAANTVMRFDSITEVEVFLLTQP
jgi:hypothetical protein